MRPPVSLARHVLTVTLAIASAASVSCKVNDYCLNCATGDGGPGDGGNGDANGDGNLDDGNMGDAGPCVVTGTEVCDNKDNDCDGSIDEGQLPEIGDLCAEQDGECQGAMKQCTNGAITCSKVPVAESCNTKDDDCDGVVDNGDPSDAFNVSGSKCGTDFGECTAGIFHCNPSTGVVTCGLNCGTGQAVDCPIGGTQAPFGTGTDTLCNAKDDDCDGSFDEDVPPGGACGGGTVNGGTSVCQQGTLICNGQGGFNCVGSIEPEPFEACDQVDNNCNGQVDEDFNLSTDPFNCGACGNVCTLPNAFEGCADPDGNGAAPPACTILACETGFHNNDGDVSTGCEFGPCTITGTVEVCNGVDDDCNPATGPNPGNEVDLTPPPNFCLTQGACAGASASCQGVDGFQCNYTADVELDTNGNVVLQETRCDGIDNDCDGQTDEGEIGLETDCAEPNEQGICQGTGKIRCVPNDPDAAPVCTILVPGQPQQAFETCNNLDDNCNGVVDEGANTGDLAGQEWVNIPGLPGVQIMKYEASRRDASDTFDGTTTNFACSKEDVLPWTNITYPDAKAVCESMTNGRLCTEAEWQQMCMPRVDYTGTGVDGPATDLFTDFTFIEAEDFFANTTIPTGDTTREWTPVTAGFNGATFMQVPNNGFSQTTQSSALAQSSRLDYKLDLLGSTNYRIWLRMRSPSGTAGAVTPTKGPSTDAIQTLAPVSDASTQVGDLIIVTTWTTATDNVVPTLTLQAGFTEVATRDYNQNGGSEQDTGRMSVAFTLATQAGAVAYQAYTASHGVSHSGIMVVRAGTFNIATIAATTREDEDDDPPDAPTSPNVGTTPSLIFVYGGWQIRNLATTVTVTPPSGFSEEWELGPNALAEFSAASSTLLSGTTNPGSFGDGGQATRGTVAIALTIGGFPASGSRTAFIGLNAGTNAGPAGAQITTTVDDQTRWFVSPQLTSGAAGTHILSIYTREDGLLIDTIAVSRQSTRSPTFDDAWAYQNNPRSPQDLTCNADPVDSDGNAGNGDQDGILPTGALNACFANHADDAFDMSGNVKEWTLARAQDQNPMRGGASNNEVHGTTCQINFSIADDEFFFPNVGFRCCRGP